MAHHLDRSRALAVVAKTLTLRRRRFLPPGCHPGFLPEVGGNFWGSVYNTLFTRWGDPYWWPGGSAWEVAVGAVLTQNTAWLNVERALAGLADRGWENAEAVLAAPEEELSRAIRSSGYYRVKAGKLKSLAAWWREWVETGRAEALPDDILRRGLLAIWGVGPETADSIACYALGRPFFVVDAYTIRVLRRLRGMEHRPGYNEVQEEVQRQLPRNAMLLNHLHGLLVVLGKEHCRRSNPRCGDCPLLQRCAFGRERYTNSNK